MSIFSKFFKKSQKSEPSKNDKKDEINNRSGYPKMLGRKPGYFREDGVWAIERDCTPEYDMGTDSLRGGWGEIALVSEYDLRVDCEIYTWQCERCGKWHGIPDFEIPERVKERIRYRSRLKRGDNPVVIDFKEYKQKRSKRGDIKKSNN